MKNALTALIQAARTALASRLISGVKSKPDDIFAGHDFVQHTNRTKNLRRAAIKAAGGIRQFKKARRAERLAVAA